METHGGLDRTLRDGVTELNRLRGAVSLIRRSASAVVVLSSLACCLVSFAFSAGQLPRRAAGCLPASSSVEEWASNFEGASTSEAGARGHGRAWARSTERRPGG